MRGGSECRLNFLLVFFGFAGLHLLSSDIKLGSTVGGKVSLANRVPTGGLIVMLLTMC